MYLQQELVRKNASEVFLELFLNHGRLYICGKIQMAQDVIKAIAEITSKCTKLEMPRFELK